MIFTRVLNLSNVAFLANLFRFKDGFSKLQMISKTKAFPYIFLRFSSRSSLTLNSAISLFFTQVVIFSVFQLSPQTRRSSSGRPVYQTIYQIRPRSDHHAGPSDQTATPDHQIRPPHQTTRSDHPTRLQTTILDYSASNHHSIPNLLKWYRSGALAYGLGEGGYIELWMNLAKHTFHTLSAWIFRTFFRLNLTVVRLASGVPRAGKVLPCPFS